MLQMLWAIRAKIVFSWLFYLSVNIKNADHFNIISPVNELFAKKILEDTGEEVNIKFDKADVKWIEDNVRR